jgi:hypothetical protein
LLSFQADEADQERYAVSRITLHPQFRQGALFNYDFAVVQLARHVDFLRMPGIRPACLPPRQQTMEQLTGHRYAEAVSLVLCVDQISVKTPNPIKVVIS